MVTPCGQAWVKGFRVLHRSGLAAHLPSNMKPALIRAAGMVKDAPLKVWVGTPTTPAFWVLGESWKLRHISPMARIAASGPMDRPIRAAHRVCQARLLGAPQQQGGARPNCGGLSQK